MSGTVRCGAGYNAAAGCLPPDLKEAAKVDALSERLWRDEIKSGRQRLTSLALDREPRGAWATSNIEASHNRWLLSGIMQLTILDTHLDAWIRSQA